MSRSHVDRNAAALNGDSLGAAHGIGVAVQAGCVAVVCHRGFAIPPDAAGASKYRAVFRFHRTGAPGERTVIRAHRAIR